MSTIHGKKPTNTEIDNDIYLLQAKVNALIKEFKAIYNEPAIIITEGAEYRLKVLILGEYLEEQYQDS